MKKSRLSLGNNLIYIGIQIQLIANVKKQMQKNYNDLNLNHKCRKENSGKPEFIDCNASRYVEVFQKCITVLQHVSHSR